MDGVVEMSNIDDPHSNADQRNNLQLYNISVIFKDCIEIIMKSALKVFDKRQRYRHSVIMLKGKKQRGSTLDSCCPNSSSFCCSGVRSCSVDAISSRILPISVLPAVATTTPTALPAAMLVP